MTDEHKLQIENTAPVEFNENSNCDICARFGALEIDGGHLCPDCHAACGSCGCAESPK